MTVAQLHVALNTRLQQVGAHVNDDFLLDELDYYLTAAQREIVVNRVQQSAGDPDQLAVNDLRPLISEQVLLPLLEATAFPAGVDNEYFCPWPGDYIMWLSSETGMTRTGNPEIASKEYIQNQAITEGQIANFRVTTEHVPHIRNPRVLVREDFLHVFCDNESTLIDQKIVYLRYPLDIILDEVDDFENQDPELPDHMHEEILERAMQKILRDLNTEPQEE